MLPVSAVAALLTVTVNSSYPSPNSETALIVVLPSPTAVIKPVSNVTVATLSSSLVNPKLRVALVGTVVIIASASYVLPTSSVIDFGLNAIDSQAI